MDGVSLHPNGGRPSAARVGRASASVPPAWHAPLENAHGVWCDRSDRDDERGRDCGRELNGEKSRRQKKWGSTFFQPDVFLLSPCSLPMPRARKRLPAKVCARVRVDATAFVFCRWRDQAAAARPLDRPPTSPSPHPPHHQPPAARAAPSSSVHLHDADRHVAIAVLTAALVVFVAAVAAGAAGTVWQPGVKYEGR